VHVPQGGAQAAATRLRRLLVDGQSFQEPARLHLIGGERLADQGIRQRGNAADVVGVHDVRVLVRDELEVPVVDVAQGRQIVRRGDIQANRVVGQRGRRPIGAIGL